MPITRSRLSPRHAIALALAALAAAIAPPGTGLPLLAPRPALAATPLTDSVFEPEDLLMKTYSGEGLPVGSVMAFPGSGTPGDGEAWLACDGGAVDAASYPELHALTGGSLPDYQGLFLRTRGGDALEVGELQEDAFAAHAHEAAALSLGLLPLPEDGVITAHLASDALDTDITLSTTTVPLYTGAAAGGTASGSGATGAYGDEETRPDNIAVRWFVRAR